MNLPADASPDQSNCPPDYYRRLNGMLHQIDQQNSFGNSGSITESDLASLEAMDKEALISLVQRMSRQCGMVAAMSEDDIRQAFLDRMAHIGLTAKAAEALAAMEKRMDRVEGKPMQRQQSLVAVADASKPLPDNDRKALEHYFKIRGFTNA